MLFIDFYYQRTSFLKLGTIDIFKPDNSLLIKVVLCIVAYSAESLASTH